MIKFIALLATTLNLNITHSENDAERFEQEFLPLKATVLNQGEYFSFSKAIAQLESLMPLAKKFGSDSQQLFDLYYIYGLVLSKREDYADKTIEFSLMTLNQFKDSKILTDDKKVYIHYRLITAYLDLEENSKSLIHTKEFLRLAPKIPEISEIQILSQKTHMEFLLHEMQQYSQALETNLEVEARADELQIEKLKYKNLYNNIAQNYYMLKQFQKSEDYLMKRMRIGLEYNDFDTQQDTLYLLAVLAFERGQLEHSKKLFLERIQLADLAQKGSFYKSRFQEDMDSYFPE